MKKLVEVLKKIGKWLWYSSANPSKIALTVQGIALLTLSEIAKALSDAGIIIPNTEIASVIIKICALFTACLAVLGFIRKLLLTDFK